jgi:hypothetical protein
MATKKMAPVHPGEILDVEFLQPMGITQYRLAKSISVSPRRINEIIKGSPFGWHAFSEPQTDSGSICSRASILNRNGIVSATLLMTKSRRSSSSANDESRGKWANKMMQRSCGLPAI